jgi:hypothetical protein
MAKIYPVGIVGEQHCREAVAKCRAGQRVVLCSEPHNPFDADAIAVTSMAGEIVGYIPKDSFLYEHINTAGGGADAVIKMVEPGSAGFNQIVLDVTLNDAGIDVLMPAPVPTSAVAVADVPKYPGNVAPWKVVIGFLTILILLIWWGMS